VYGSKGRRSSMEGEGGRREARHGHLTDDSLALADAHFVLENEECHRLCPTLPEVSRTSLRGLVVRPAQTNDPETTS
jgi:hypothetical protein